MDLLWGTILISIVVSGGISLWTSRFLLNKFLDFMDDLEKNESEYILSIRKIYEDGLSEALKAKQEYIESKEK